MKRLIDWILGKRPQPVPVRVRRMTMAQALDISRDHGYNTVDWRMVVC